MSLIYSDMFNMSIDTDVLDNITEQLEDVIDDIEDLQYLKKIGINFKVQYLLDSTEWEDISCR